MTKNHERINQLFEELVPASGKAENLAGELVRAMARIGYRWYNDGNQVGIGYGRETCNPAARFLIHKGNKEVSDLAASTARKHTKSSSTFLPGRSPTTWKDTRSFAPSRRSTCGTCGIPTRTWMTGTRRKRTGKPDQHRGLPKGGSFGASELASAVIYTIHGDYLCVHYGRDTTCYIRSLTVICP